MTFSPVVVGVLFSLGIAWQGITIHSRIPPDCRTPNPFAVSVILAALVTAISMICRLDVPPTAVFLLLFILGVIATTGLSYMFAFLVLVSQRVLFQITLLAWFVILYEGAILHHPATLWLFGLTTLLFLLALRLRENINPVIQGLCSCHLVLGFFFLYPELFDSAALDSIILGQPHAAGMMFAVEAIIAGIVFYDVILLCLALIVLVPSILPDRQTGRSMLPSGLFSTPLRNQEVLIDCALLVLAYILCEQRIYPVSSATIIAGALAAIVNCGIFTDSVPALVKHQKLLKTGRF